MSPDVKDMTGRILGTLLFGLYPTRTVGGAKYWMFRCDCGNVKELSGASVRRGKTTSCGCVAKAWRQEMGHLQKDMGHGSRTKDLTGERFDRLTAVAAFEERGSCGTVRWYCICKCGTEKIVTSHDLIDHRVTSCGCKHREHCRTIRHIVAVARAEQKIIQQRVRQSSLSSLFSPPQITITGEVQRVVLMDGGDDKCKICPYCRRGIVPKGYKKHVECCERTRQHAGT